MILFGTLLLCSSVVSSSSFLLPTTSFLATTQRTFTTRHGRHVTEHKSFELFSQTTSRQVLDFREPQTNVTVTLVGSMHYNPSSIQLAVETVQGYAQQEKLGAVIVESCATRWNEANELYKQNPLLKDVLQNEMRASSQVAFDYNVPVVLGDACINATMEGLKTSLMETIVDLVQRPVQLYQDIAHDFPIALPVGPQYLDATSFLDFQLLSTFPVSLVKYPLSFVSKSPIKGILFFLLVLLLSSGGGIVDPQEIQGEELFWNLGDAFLPLVIAILEITIFSRVFTRELLIKRNEVLARNILYQCQLLVHDKKKKKKWKRWFQRDADHKNEHDVVYATMPRNQINDSTAASSKVPSKSIHNNKEKVVVAVLGLAHVNGIKKLLCEEQEE